MTVQRHRHQQGAVEPHRRGCCQHARHRTSQHRSRTKLTLELQPPHQLPSRSMVAERRTAKAQTSQPAVVRPTGGGQTNGCATSRAARPGAPLQTPSTRRAQPRPRGPGHRAPTTRTVWRQQQVQQSPPQLPAHAGHHHTTRTHPDRGANPANPTKIYFARPIGQHAETAQAS